MRVGVCEMANVVCLFGGRFNYLVTLKTQVLNSTGVRPGTQLHNNEEFIIGNLVSHHDGWRL